ncbi:CHD6 [Hepatospora eriocheir]|uniref:CHD6 n=1 Tax=Hepatospora eriocheir TaxID=1081669 RepID=A0A1X0QF11_9MICR|nr:CHD6 [Hepatospora eriocheir]
MSFDNKPVPASEKNKEKLDSIQMLLKKGAYGALMNNDDEADKFCEENIDKILERSTVVQKSESGNVFSKATFQFNEEIDDPFFWDFIVNQKKGDTSEMKIRRHCRKLAREGSLSEIMKEDLMNIEQKLGENFNKDSQEYFLKIFLIILLHNISDLNSSIFDEELKDDALIVGQIYKYCIDLVSNQKTKGDFMDHIDYINVPYDATYFEKYSEIYLKYHEQYLFKVQIPILVYKVKDFIDQVDSRKGFNKQDDLDIVDKITKLGYNNFTIKSKSADEVMQRVRKIITVLYRKINTEENDNLYFKAIINFGRVTELNKDSIIEFIGKQPDGIREIVNKISQSSKKPKKDSIEYNCYERIQFFDKLTQLNEIPTIKKINMPKYWNKESDYKLREYLLTNGFSKLKIDYQLNEDQVIKRFETLFNKALND